MPAHAKPGVGGLTISRDRKTLVVAGGDARIRFIDIATGQVKRILTGHTNVVYTAIFSPDEKLLASSSRDLTARIWDVASGRELWKLDGFRCAVKTVAFSHDGRMLAAAGNDGLVKLYEVETGKELRSFIHINSANVDMSVYSVVFGPHGRKVYAANGDGTISEWDVTLGKETRAWKAHDHTTHRLVFSPDYSLLASLGDAVVKLWDAHTWREVRSLSMARTAEAVIMPSALAFSHDGKLIAASNVELDQKQTGYLFVQTLVWKLNGEKLFTLEGHKFDVDALLFSPDDQLLLTGSVDTTIKFWELKTGQLSRSLTITAVPVE